MADVIKIGEYNKSGFKGSIDDISADIDDMKCVSAILIWKTNETDGGEHAGLIKHAWFGDNSSIECLGLVTRMKDIISDYIRGIV